MKRISKVKLLSSFVLTALLVPASSCGLLGSDTSHGDVEARPANPIPTTAVRLPGEAGTFGRRVTVAVPSDLSTFNPYYQTDASTKEILGQMYAPLVGFDPVKGELDQAQGLAEKFEANGNKVTIKLRDGLKFSDGSDITAGDVLYSFKVATDEQVQSPIADMLTVSGRLPDIAKLDPKTVQLTFVEAYPAIGYVLSQMPVISAGPNADETLDKGRFETALGPSTNPATIPCSGPFHVAAYTKGKEIDLAYNPNYYKVDSQGKRLPYLDHLVYKFALPPDEIANSLKAGTVDVAANLGPAKFAELGAGGDKFATTDAGVGVGTWQLLMNMRVDKTLIDPLKATWFRNDNFRQAISRLMDRDKIAKEAFAGKAVPVFGPVSPANDKWTNKSITKFEYDPVQAQKLLDTAQFKMGDNGGKPQLLDQGQRKVSFNLFYPKNDPAAEKMKDIVVAGLTSKGIAVTPTAVDPSQLLTNFIIPGKYEMALWRADGFGPDPISYMPVFMSNGSKHYYLNTPPGTEGPFPFEVDINRLMRSQQDKTLANERQPDFTKAQKLLSDNVPCVYLVADNVQIAYNKKLGNFHPLIYQPYATWNAEQLYYKE